MKKLICITLIVTHFMSLLAITSSAKEEPNDGLQTDPNYEYHLKISNDIDALRETRNEQIEVYQNEIQMLRNHSMELYNDFLQTYAIDTQNTYIEIVSAITTLEDKINALQINYFNDVHEYLKSSGMEIIDDAEYNEFSDDIHVSATDAGYMQTTSSVSYDSKTKEFYYFVEYDYNEKRALGYYGLDDSWGDYDLVSMQHKENTDWYWNNIIVTANLAHGFTGNSLAGKADKYQILDKGLFNASAVSNREDLWNGCIFNIKDDDVSGPQQYSGHIRYITLEGWLKPTGSDKSTQVKSEYEHNEYTASN